MSSGQLKKILCIGIWTYVLTACTVLTPVPPPAPTKMGTTARSTPSAPRVTITSLARGLTPHINRSAYDVAAAQPDPVSTGNLWDKVPYGFQIAHETHNPEVKKHINWFLKHPEYLSRISRRAEPYIYYIYDQIQQRNLPMELVLLPVNESAYDPFANSNRGAGGMWQMIRGTATQYGVKQNWYYDGRRDVYASTKAALDHLAYLNNFFDGDWLLTFAAYDSGEGTVQRAIRRNAKLGKPTDFWSLSLPAETKAYVPRLLALAAIIGDRQNYDIDLPPIDDQPYFARVDVSAPVSLTDAAKMAGISLMEVKKLNPGYRYWNKVPLGPYKLVLPVDRIDTFKKNLAFFEAHPPGRVLVQAKPSTTAINLANSKPIYHLVKAGSNLGTIAKLYKVSVNDIEEWNQLSSHNLRAGSKIIVGYSNLPETKQQLIKPTDKPEMHLVQETPKPEKRLVQEDRAQYYTVRKGDSLSRIAKQHHVQITNLRKLNKLADSSTIQPGTKLIIKG